MLSSWRLYAAAALILALAAGGWMVRGWREDSKALAGVRAELVTVTAERDTLRGAVDSWVKAAADAEERAKAAEAKAGQVRVEWRTRVETVTHEVPVPTPDATCEEVRAWADGRYTALVSSFSRQP